MKPYEVIDHTADIGLKIFGDTLPELFTHAALGLFDLITEIDKIPSGKEEVSFHLQADDLSQLFFKWLQELLFVFSVRRLVFKKFDFIILNEKELKAVGYGEKFDPKKHEQKCEVKAVTYHQYKVEKEKSGWIAQVIFDI